jgi:succinate dehydrogenase / fumarate reductase, cytochrome b subunit
MRELFRKNYFLLKRLHSLSGIIPVGVFFLIHMFLNSRANQSPAQYQWVPNTLDQVPFLWAIELGGIILPFLFHGVLGVFFALDGQPNSHQRAYSWYKNWAYTLQRWTGVILAFLIAGHLWQTWWQHMQVKLAGGHEFDIYGLMYGIVHNPFWLAAYALFVAIAAFHFGNGIYNFFYKWGFTTNTRAMHWTLGLGLLVALIGLVLGWSSLWGLSFSEWARDWGAQFTASVVSITGR